MKHWVGIGILAGLLAAACGTRQMHQGGVFAPLGETGHGSGSNHTNSLGTGRPSRYQNSRPAAPKESAPAEDEPGDSGPEFLMPHNRNQAFEI